MLGTLNDENSYFPHNINPKMYEEGNVHSIALGTQHVVALVSKSESLPPMKLDEFEAAKDAPPVQMEDDVKSNRSSKKGFAQVFSQQQEQANVPETIPEVPEQEAPM